MNQRATLTLCSTLLFCAIADAQQTCLKDGRVLVGKVTEQPGEMIEVMTRDGAVRVAKSEVESTKPEAELQKELARMEQSAPATPFSHLELAKQARCWGLERELWLHLDAATAVPRDAANGGLRGRVDDFLARLEPELLARKYRSAPTAARVEQLLAQLHRDSRAGRTAAVQELLVREPNADQDLRVEARRNQESWRRLCALTALSRRGTRGNDTFTWRTAILDPSEAVRSEAIQIARSSQDPTAAVKYLAPGLMASSPELRVRTAEAFANLGDPAAIKLLVMAGPNANKALADADPGFRAHVAFVEQQAYIRDFDVEVAQAAFIADPKIGVLQSGMVLDVTVHAVIEEAVRIVKSYRGALKRLAGSDPGPKPGDWATWLAGLPDSSRTAPTTGAPAPKPKDKGERQR